MRGWWAGTLAVLLCHGLFAATLTVNVVGPGKRQMKNIAVRVVGHGECITRPNGECPLQIGDEVVPGFQIQLTVQPDTWTIQNYPGGLVEFPKSHVVRLVIAPKGSESLLTDGRLRFVLRNAFEQPASSGAPGGTTQDQALENWILLTAREVGLPVATIQARLDEFVARKSRSQGSDAVLADLYSKNYEQAAARAEANIRLNNAEQAQNYLLLGHARLGQLDFQKAGAAYTASLGLDADNPDLLSAMALFCHAQATAPVTDAQRFKCADTATNYWERSLKAYQMRKPFDLRMQSFVINQLAAVYSDLPNTKTREQELAQAALQIRERANQMKNPAASDIGLLTVLTLVAAGAPNAQSEIDKVLAEPASSISPYSKTILLEAAAIRSFKQGTIAGVTKGMDQFEQAGNICPADTKALACRTLHIIAVSLGL